MEPNKKEIVVGDLLQWCISDCNCIDKIVGFSSSKVMIRVLKGCNCAGIQDEHHSGKVYSLPLTHLRKTLELKACTIIPKVKAVLYDE